MNKFIGYLAIVNFFCFLVTSVFFGGDALSGKVENGHFFLSSHGRLTEVSENIFIYSKIHAWSVFILVGLAVIVHYSEKSK